MKTIHKGCGEGKTFDCIVESGKTGSVIVCANDFEAERVKFEAYEIGIKIPKPMSFHRSKTLTMGKFNTGCIVDNCDWILESFLGCKVRMVTFDDDYVDCGYHKAKSDCAFFDEISCTDKPCTNLRRKNHTDLPPP